MEKDGKMSDDDDAPTQTFHEEQEQLKKGFKAVLQDSDSDTEDLLKIRPKSDAQRVREVISNLTCRILTLFLCL